MKARELASLRGRLWRGLGARAAALRCAAEEAERAGLVSRLVPVADLMDEAVKVADRIAGMSRPVTMMVKESVNRAYETTLAEGVRFERRLFHSIFGTEDQKEGMAAFLEKRHPEFKHR